MRKGCRREHDGVYREYWIGHLSNGPLHHAVLLRGQVKFGWAKSEMLPQSGNQESRRRAASEGEGDGYLGSGDPPTYSH